jgi:hypothetical protein
VVTVLVRAERIVLAAPTSLVRPVGVVSSVLRSVVGSETLKSKISPSERTGYFFVLLTDFKASARVALISDRDLTLHASESLDKSSQFA